MLAPLLSPVPAINIELAVEQIPLKEPSSPFNNVLFSVTNSLDAYRSNHLLPPPVCSPKEHVRSVQATTRGQGIDAARFEALRIAASKNFAKTDLRKELAIRAHQSKQSESVRPFFAYRQSHESHVCLRCGTIQTEVASWLLNMRRCCTDGGP